MVFNGQRSVLNKYPSRNKKECTFTYEDFDVHHCASVNDAWKLRKLFKFSKHKDVNLQDDDFGGRSALHIACEKGNVVWVIVGLNFVLSEISFCQWYRVSQK